MPLEFPIFLPVTNVHLFCRPLIKVSSWNFIPQPRTHRQTDRHTDTARTQYKKKSQHKLSLHLIIENCPKDHFHREQIRVYVKGKSYKKFCIYKSVYSATLANDWRNLRPFLYVYPMVYHLRDWTGTKNQLGSAESLGYSTVHCYRQSPKNLCMNCLQQITTLKDNQKLKGEKQIL